MKKILLLISIIILTTGCTSKKDNFSESYNYMDTLIQVKLYDVTKKEADISFDEIENILKTYHELSNRYNKYESITNIYTINNENNYNTEIKIDSKLYNLLQTAVDYSNDTDGLFRITIGNLVDLYKPFYNDTTDFLDIDYNSLKSINKDDLVLLGDNTIMLKNNVSLDLGGIAKGYTTELVSNYLEDNNIKKYLINAGGNIVVGDHYENDTYKVGIQSPIDDTDIFFVVNATNTSVVTSGGYERFFEYNGTLYHHILNPETLMPSNTMKSITVITKSSTYADFLSTYLFLLPVDEALDYANTHDDVEVVIFDNDDEIIKSNGVSQYE